MLADVEARIEATTNLQLLERLLDYQYEIGDYSHQRGCMTNQTHTLTDCSCGLKELNQEIEHRVRGSDENQT